MSEDEMMNGQQTEKPSLFGMIMHPAEQFNRLRDRPIFLVPLIIVSVITAIGMVMMMNNVDFMGVDDPNMQIPADEMAMIETIAKVSFLVVGIVTPVISILISTVIYFIVAKIVHASVTFKQLFSMTTFIYLISALGLIINGLAMMLTGAGDPELLFTSLNSVIGAEGVAGAFFNMFEVFAIWALILGALGLQIVARFSKGLSWGVVIGMFVIGAIFAMVGAGLSSMMGAF